MERKNYFELLGLDFDPPEKNDPKIKKAIAAWKQRTEDLLANETSASRRTALNEELSLHGDIVALMSDKTARGAEARALKEQRLAQLEKLIDIMLMGQSGTPEVTNAQIRNVHLKLKLQPDTIESTYKKKGFVVQKRNQTVNLREVFLTTPIANKLKGSLDRLQTMTFQQYDWTKKVQDLYDLACYFSGGSDSDRQAYHKKRTADLKSIMEAGAAQYATDMSDQGHLMGDLFSTGKTQIFDSEASRKKYDNTRQREKLSEFFSLLKSAPEDFKKDRFFAESCIRTIQAEFSDYDLALTLYNNEAGLLQDPYEPIEALIHVTCPSCRHSSEFRTREQAVRGKCAVCGAPLYVECPKCKNKVPASADRCSCGFLISEMQFFDDYVKEALFALKEMNLSEASRQLENAENAYPGHPQLAALRSQVKAEIEKYKKPLTELSNLIAAGLFSKAQALLTNITATNPQLKVEAERKVISEKLAEAQRKMPPIHASDAEKANRCVEVLQIVKDYQPALDMIVSLRPKAPANLAGSVSSGGKLTCTLSWHSAGDKGVTYQVVRKQNGTPKRAADGEVLAKDLTTLQYTDTTLQPGICYGYAVFASRYGAFSDPAVCEVENFSELDQAKLQAIAEDRSCRFSWVLPVNCVGVRILRATNAIPPENPVSGVTVVSNNASGSFQDKSLANGTRYGYRLQCIYPYGSGYRYSRGLTITLSPEPTPVSLNGLNARVEGRLVTVRWKWIDTMQQSVQIREVQSDAPRSLVGQLMSHSDINNILGKGRVLASGVSTAQECRFEIPANSSLSVAVVTGTGSQAIVSDILTVSSVEKCEINKTETRMEGYRLKIVLNKLPKYLDRIYYLVAQKTDSKIPWATRDDARNNVLRSISADDYDCDGMILVDNPPKDYLYVTVIGRCKMPDGSLVYAEPSKLKLSNKPKEKITYHLRWASGGLFGSKRKAKDCRLVVECTCAERPAMQLVYCTDKHIPMNLNDPTLKVLKEIDEEENGIAGKAFEYAIEDEVWRRIPADTPLRLMLQPEDMVEYDILPTDVESLKVPNS